MAVVEKEFPDHLVPLGDESFCFQCHSELECFTTCCKKVDIALYPFDILSLKNALGIDSEKFIQDHVQLGKGSHPYFPVPMLKLAENEACPFLTEEGCSVYTSRPSACRTYPLERAVDRTKEKGRPQEFYFKTNHSYCLGHGEPETFTVQKWVRNQRIDQFNVANDLWAELDSLFRTNPWQGEGHAGPKQQMAFMICYNIDGFRRFSDERKLVEQFKVGRDKKRRIAEDDHELQKFGYEWLKFILTGKSSLLPR